MFGSLLVTAVLANAPVPVATLDDVVALVAGGRPPAEVVAAIEAAGLGFIGPSSRVIRQAGAKDEAKKLARKATSRNHRPNACRRASWAASGSGSRHPR